MFKVTDMETFQIVLSKIRLASSDSKCLELLTTVMFGIWRLPESSLMNIVLAEM